MGVFRRMPSCERFIRASRSRVKLAQDTLTARCGHFQVGMLACGSVAIEIAEKNGFRRSEKRTGLKTRHDTPPKMEGE
jgi:hypothetical protein